MAVPSELIRLPLKDFLYPSKSRFRILAGLYSLRLFRSFDLYFARTVYAYGSKAFLAVKKVAEQLSRGNNNNGAHAHGGRQQNPDTSWLGECFY